HCPLYFLFRPLLRRCTATLFPYTTLFRSDASRRQILQAFAPRAQGVGAPPAALATDVLIATDLVSEGLNLQDAERVIHYDLPWRSEEHTSELQSLRHLVCRLLLEKKKNRS